MCICTVTNSQILSGSCPAPTQNNCPENSYWVPGTNSCRCNPPYSWVYGQCRLPSSCLANAYWNGVECVCNYGYIKVNNNCVPTNKTYYCPPNSFFNGVNCQCISGYMATQNGCIKCPFGRYWTGEGCGTPQTCTGGYIWYLDIQMCLWEGYRCKNNEYWDGSNCRCKPGYFWLSVNGCQKCPAGTFYDGISCVSGLINRSCNDPYQFWNGVACVCVTGFWMIDGKYCITCPSQMVWNGYYCETQRGLTFALADDSSRSNSNTVPATYK